jgi:diguanylate cyclase (GGDEF)-like protein
MVIVIPLCTWLFFQGTGFILWGFGILLFSFYTILVVYSYFQVHFDAIYFHLQNRKLLSYLKFSNNKLAKMNENLNIKNNELYIEIKRRHKVEKKLEKFASHDGLTGLPNRLLLEDRLNQTVLSSKREHYFFAVLFIDLDDFKIINDTFGHEMGDKILKAIAARLKETLRAEDTVSRIGGDEFVILIPHLEHEKDVSPIAEKLIKSLSDTYIVGKHLLTCRASMGITFFPSGGLTFRSLIKNADAAMYKAKKAGGSRFEFYSPPYN